jgi:UDP-N-acetyl-D-mannosaminuronate dehydrogenase
MKFDLDESKIVVIGLGYVGLDLSPKLVPLAG